MTFLDDVHAGRIHPDRIDDYIDRWHDEPSPFGPKLHTYLGLTWEQYKTWCQSGDLPPAPEHDWAPDEDTNGRAYLFCLRCRRDEESCRPNDFHGPLDCVPSA